MLSKLPNRSKLEKIYPLIIILLGIVVLILLNNKTANAKNKLDLDDLEVKGELINDDRLVILNREKNELSNFVKFRTNFRSEIVEELPTPAPGVKY